MAVELATGYVNLVPSAKGIRAAIQKELGQEIGPAADAVGDEAGQRMGGRIRSQLGTMAKAGTAIFGGLLAVAGGWGLKLAAENQTAQVSFETMLGSADKATSFLTDLRNFAAATPFEFPELQTAAGSLISIGIESSKVIPIMTTLGNVTSGMGTGAEGVKRATVALQQMNAAGRITAEDLNQLRDAGVPVFDLLAAATGKSKEAIAEMAQTGKLGKEELTQLMSALETGKGLERFNGLMEAQSQTLTGLISTIKDTLGQGLATALQPLVPVLTALLPQVADVLGKIIGNLGPLLSGVVANFLPIAQALLPVLSQVASIVASVLMDALKALQPVFETLIPPLRLLLSALTPLLTVFVQLAGTVLQSLAVVLAQVATALAPVVDALIQGMLPVLDEIMPMIPQLVQAFLPLIPSLGQILVALAPLVAMLATLGTRVIAKLLPYIIPLIESFSKWASEMLTKLIPAIETVVNWLIDFFDNLINLDGAGLEEMLGGLWQSISSWFTDTAIPGLTEFAKQMGTALLGWLAEVIPQIPGKLAAFLAAVGGWVVGTALPWLGEKLLALAGAFVGWVAEAVPMLLGKLGELLSALGGWIAETAIPWLLSKGVEMSLALLAWIVQAAIEAPGRLSNLFATIATWLATSAIPWILEKALELRNAILGWIGEAVTEAPGRLLGFANAVLDFIRELPGKITDASKGMFVGITNAFIAAINWIIRTWNGFQLKLPEIEVFGQKVGGFTLDTPDLPEIPSLQGLAKGGVTKAMGGLFQLHKDEFVALPGRATVFPQALSRAVESGEVGPGPRAPIVFDIDVHADTTEEAFDRIERRTAMTVSNLG